ncbi:hypothetical protein GCM10010232_42500 [Streptomyces amakusaensis]|uniref:Uncharacterized protein n=1 Tax=Streptomyces amakusaensis TaxID=67271 RepID=A0ABW0AGA5_9ACTN
MEASLATPMIMGIHGVLTLHPWIRRQYAEGTLDEDVFSLVATRATAYGWLGSTEPVPVGVRWGHNDADGDWEQDGRIRELGWMQIDVGDTPSGQRLPVLPAATVLGEGLARVGRLDFTGLHTVAPLRLAGDSRLDLLEAAGWFGLGDPEAESAFTMTVAGTEPAGIPGLASALLDGVRERARDLLTIEPLEPPAPDAPALTPATQPGLAHPPSGGPDAGLAQMTSGRTFRCTAREWSLDLASWVTEMAIDALRETGLTQPVAIAVSRTGPAGPR